MAITRISRAFKDISFDFEPNPVTKDISVLKNESAIRRSVRNLVETIPTERFFNSLLGSNVRSTLFNFIDDGTASIIADQIETVIANYEPRVENVRVFANPQPDENSFDVTILFDIIGQEFPRQEFNFILEATR